MSTRYAPAIAGAVLTADGQGVACLVPMPDRCQRRADIVRQYADDISAGGQLNGRDDVILARRIAWDAHAAVDYPRPMLADAVDLAASWPTLSSVVWHLVAGATILGPGCDCQSPAAHRDALVELAVIIAAHAIRSAS